jgi:hypothetical protein
VSPATEKPVEQNMQASRIVVVLVALGLGGVPAIAQSLLVTQGQVIAYSGPDGTVEGDLAPGLTMGERFGGGSGPTAAAIDDAGNMLWRAQLVNSMGVGYSGIQAHLGRGLWVGDARGSLVKVVRGGDPEPSGTLTGFTVNNQFGNGIMTGNPRIAPNGLILFGTNIWDPIALSTHSGNDSALYAGIPGIWQMVAREGGAAPGLAGVTYAQDFSGMSTATCWINSSGQVAFLSSLAGTGVVTTNDTAWFTGTAGNVQLLVREGDLGPGNATISSVGNSAHMNAAGQILTSVTYLQGSGLPLVTSADDKSLWLYTPGTGNAQLVREGSASPIAGTFWGELSLSNNASFNNAGAALVGTTLTGAVSLGFDDAALFIVGSAAAATVVRRGDVAPGTGGLTFNTVATFNMCLNDSGVVAFNSTITAPAANDSGLWVGTPGNLTLIAREGDVAPGSGGQTFLHFSGNVMLNAAGQVLFANALSGGGNAQSYYAWDPVFGLQPVNFPQDSIEVSPGVFRNTANIASVAAGNGGGRPLAFANDGTVTLRPSFTGGGLAIMTVRIGSLTGAPGKISAAAGGTQKLYLNAGPANAGQTYVMAGTLSGTVPGTPIGTFVVPLNIDDYTLFTLQNPNVFPFVNTAGTLDANGRALAQIVIPPVPWAAGIVAHHAYGVIGGGNLLFASETARLEFTP